MATHDDLCRALTGLHEATPPGVTFSHVELDNDGGLHLRGQAKSLASAFLLLENMEKQIMFEQVLLLDAGQSMKAGGSITEFRIDCRLKRPEVR